MDSLNTTNIQNCGINQGAGGNITAGNNLTININPPTTGTSTPTRRTPFRFNVPTPTRHFKGRIKTMEEVRDHFTKLYVKTVDCWDHIVAIVGLGGMGKTETAYKFAAEFKETFPNVAWIHAETESSALASFMGLAKHLKIVANDRKEADLDLVREVYHHLDKEDYGKTIFVFDNAIRLSSDEEEFGIMEYLPTNDLPNQRFPNVLITTQTHDWERRIETFQIDELTEIESLEFFRSCFQIESAECDHLFKMLHTLLEGYPLVMNLAASQVDYNPKKDSVHQLQQQTQSYIDKLEKEQEKLVNEKVNRVWPTKYSKTLSNALKLTFERMEQEDDGCDALELLQLMSFLRVPIHSGNVVEILIRSSDCPHPLKEELELRLRELLRVLERFYTVRKSKVYLDDDKGLSCHLGIHRLVQLVVRQQTDSSKGLQRLLCYLARRADKVNYNVNKSALQEALLEQSQLSQRALPYVGIIACRGNPAACKFVETRPPETKAAAAIWRLYNLERGMTYLNENAIQVLHELIGLTKSEERLEDRKLFGILTTSLLVNDGFEHNRDIVSSSIGAKVPWYFILDSLEGVEELVTELVLNVCSMHGSSCKSYYCQKDQKTRDFRLSFLTAKLTKVFVRVDAPKPTLAVDVIAETCVAILARLRYYDADNGIFPDFLLRFSRSMYQAFHSPDASQSRIASLRTCLWKNGLATELIQVFGFISGCFFHVDEYSDPFLLNLMDVCVDGMDVTDERVQQVMSAFCYMITTIEMEFIYKDYSDVPDKWRSFTVELCSVWIKLFLMDEDSPPQRLLESLSRLKFLDWMERSPKFDKWMSPFFSDLGHVPREYLHKYYPQFIKRFSSFDMEAIQTLVHVCQRLMEDH